jgi:hypothetical protein
VSRFDEIRAACRGVVERARWVSVEQAPLERLARSLSEEAQTLTPSWDPIHHQRGDAATTAAFVITLDAVNFGSGWFPQLRKPEGYSGYRTIASAVARRFDARGPFSARELAGITQRECAALFEQDLASSEVAQLMALFARAWRDLGELLGVHYDGRFDAFVAKASESAARLVEQLAAMPLYRDVAHYHGMRVPLYKRAQITASDLAHACRGEGLGRFRDLDELTSFADNLVPHVLRCHGVLAYHAELARRIDAGEPLAAGSNEEIEIRAVGLHAVEKLSAATALTGARVPPRRLDELLWNRGQAPEIKARPRHRAKSVYY